MQENSDYHRFIANILVPVNNPLYMIKYISEGKLHKAHFVKKEQKRSSKSYYSDYCYKSGHTKKYCFSDSESGNYKVPQSEGKTNIPLHTIAITNPTVQKLRIQVVIDSRAIDHSFCDEVFFVEEIL